MPKEGDTVSKKPKFKQAIQVSIEGHVIGQVAVRQDIKQVSTTVGDGIKAKLEELHELLNI
jgi:hypothetical protein